MVAVPFDDNGEHYATCDIESEWHGRDLTQSQPSFCESFLYQFVSNALQDLDDEIFNLSSFPEEDDHHTVAFNQVMVDHLIDLRHEIYKGMCKQVHALNNLTRR